MAETTGIPWVVDESAPNAKHLPKVRNRITVFPHHVTAAIRLLPLTGARLREILNLRWDEVDFDRRLAFLPDSKTGRKTLVLNSSTISVLQSLQREGAYVIPGLAPDKPHADLNAP